ncbi:MAG: bifunctional riboflavin kinase/FAD synthetase [Zoogloeaceae bacterium]|jgi:riboflavin kinase/FMN adenylyltransferase|nr:bifunctional riboflavin kinase/FAD synthetase [Zoogloeaceae bacterium]
MRVYRGVHHSQHTPTVLAVGNFDGVHLGHQALLSRLKDKARACGHAAAVMTFEPHPREFFSPGTAPARLTPLREKLVFFAEAEIDLVFVIPFNRAFAALDAEDFLHGVLLRVLNMRHLIIGDDFRFGCDRRGDRDYLRMAARRLDFTMEATSTVSIGGERVSSSAIRQALGTGNLVKAAAFLGRPYATTGRVVHGRRLGRQLGFPTANLYLRHAPLPLTGVFAIRVLLDGRMLSGVSNVGLRPTLETGEARALLEAHVLDFQGDLYGRLLTIEFAHRLREEMKFSSLDVLKAQIARDVDAARDFFRREREAPENEGAAWKANG